MMVKTGRPGRLGFPKVAAIVTLMAFIVLYIMNKPGISFTNYPSDLLALWFMPSLPAADQLQSGEELAEGKLLVASRQIRSSLFAESVVLLIDYNLSGTMGLIINKKTGIKLSTILPEIEGLKKKEDTVYIGGPVSGDKITMLIRSKDHPDKSQHVFEDIYFGFSKAVLQEMVDDDKGEDSFHLFAGYSGWAPGQLENELSRGDWHVMEADVKFVFAKEPSDVWHELISRTSVRWAGVKAKENTQQFSGD